MVNSRNMKMTPVGLIPEDWNIIQLADYIVDINDGPFGSNLKSEHYTLDREVRIIQLGNVGDDGWNDENVKYTTFEHASTLKRCIVPYGTIIIAKMMPAGRAIICPSSEPAYIQGSDVIKVVFTDSIDKDFFIYLTKSKAYIEQIESGVQGSTRARTNIGKIKSLKLPLPSVKEQKRIAGALLSVDKMIGALDEAIAKKRQIKEGLMQQLLTGKTRLPGFNGEWEDIPFKSIYKYAKEGGTPSTGVAEYYNPAIVPFAKIEDLKDKYLTRVESYISESGVEHSSAWLIPVNSVILSNGATLGEVSINKIPTTTKQGILGIILKEDFSPEFIYYLFKGRSFRREMEKVTTHGTMDCAYLKDLNTISLRIPPLTEQEAIASVISSVDKEIVGLESQRDKYALIKQGMMQELLTGKTRLI